MAPESTPGAYSHDAAVSAINSFLTFIKRMYGGVAGLRLPPPEGWPQMTLGLAQPLGLTPEAVRLLRYIPHFETDDVCIMRECFPVDWVARFEYYLRIIDETGNPPPTGFEDWPELDPGYPPHIFEIGRPSSRYGCALIIDTKRGVAIWHNVDGAPPFEGVPEPDADYEDDEAEPWGSQGWKRAPTYRIETFCAMAEEQLKIGNWVPELEASGYMIQELRVYGQPNEEQRERVKIMRDAGWPGEQWDASRARDATDEWASQKYQKEKARKEQEKALENAKDEVAMIDLE